MKCWRHVPPGYDTTDQHFISQAAIALVVLNVLILKITCQTFYVKLQYCSGHGLTCLGGSPSHALCLPSELLFHK